MGLRFRKSINIGPFRMNISKSGISHSVGIKGFRKTKLANGRTRTTISIPGTGISYVTEERSRKRNIRKKTTKRVNDFDGKNPKTKKNRMLPFIIISIILGIFILGTLSSENESNIETIKISSDTKKYEINNEYIFDISTTPSNYKGTINVYSTNDDVAKASINGNKITIKTIGFGDTKIYVDSNGIKSNKISIEIKEQAKENSNNNNHSQNTVTPSLNSNSNIENSQNVTNEVPSANNTVILDSTPQGQMVWISATGSKYHSINNCGRMNPNTASYITINEAINMGLSPCSKCF